MSLDFFETTLGPSFNLKRWGADNSRGYIYAIGDLAYLGYDYYFSAPGAGVRFLSFAAEKSVLDARFETRDRQFNDTSDLPTNSLRTGWQTRFGATYSYYLTPGLRDHHARLRAARGRSGGLLRGLGDGGFGRLRLDVQQSAVAGPISLDVPVRRRSDSPEL